MRHATALIAILYVFLSVERVRADLLINPSGGTVLFSSATNHDDEVSSGRSLGFTGNFYGAPYTTIDVDTNGNLHLGGPSNPNNSVFPMGIPTIAPLWDDLSVYSGSGQSISEKVSAGNYYSVTWDVATYLSASTFQRFQAAWFGAPTLVGTFLFLPDDIAFSYDLVTANFRLEDATVGLNKGDAGIFTPLPGDPDAVITNAQASLLPTGVGDVILFRPDGLGGYTAQVINVAAVPEPSSLILCGLTVIGMLVYSRRRLFTRCNATVQLSA